jgi:hypothetical protein
VLIYISAGPMALMLGHEWQHIYIYFCGSLWDGGAGLMALIRIQLIYTLRPPDSVIMLAYRLYWQHTLPAKYRPLKK